LNFAALDLSYAASSDPPLPCVVFFAADSLHSSHSRHFSPYAFVWGVWGVRVSFNHREKFRLLGPNRLEVVVSIHFSEGEEAIIAACGLKDFVVIERMPTIFKDFNDEWREIDNNIYLERLLRDTHAEPVISPTHAKMFEQDMLLALEPIERYLSRYASPDTYHETAPQPDLTI
jgi:hypothetical protein